MVSPFFLLLVCTHSLKKVHREDFLLSRKNPAKFFSTVFFSYRATQPVVFRRVLRDVLTQQWPTKSWPSSSFLGDREKNRRVKTIPGPFFPIDNCIFVATCARKLENRELITALTEWSPRSIVTGRFVLIDLYELERVY